MWLLMTAVLDSISGLSRDYWMDDENCKECYDCKSVFSAWRRKHHCRICGQIFCSRCASNIIKGIRFGHDGMIRVCNLCLDKLATDSNKPEDDEEDDRRSIMSSVIGASLFSPHQMASESVSIPNLLASSSPFAASQLFSRTDEPFNLYSIAETRKSFNPDQEDLREFGTQTPYGHRLRHDSTVEEPIRDNPAPFRRAVTEDDKDHSGSIHELNPTNPPSKTKLTVGSSIVFKPTANINDEGPSSIEFPVSSPNLEDSPARRGDDSLHSRFNSFVDLELPTALLRSRAQSKQEAMIAESGWRTRRESTAYAHELNLVSMQHLRVMLRQMLIAAAIPNLQAWEETLLKLSLKIAKELSFTGHSHRPGEDIDMDIRRYVKIKKMPGGRPMDSEFVDGAVITKNVAHKRMLRQQRNPRVMLVTFPLEFQRVEGQYMHFGQVVRQEKEYLGNLAARIAALRPHVVLVGQSVSGIALEYFAKHKIAVARRVKPSAVHLVARMTQSHIFSSIDKLALEPKLGHCSKFSIQTFDHPSIPGRRKTYMRFEGCSRDTGCTIILRGESMETLKRIKTVTRFLAFIVRNLKLETYLWKDSVINPVPFHLPTATEQESKEDLELLSRVRPGQSRQSCLDLLQDATEQQLLSRLIQVSVIPYKSTFISVSATISFPPPYPLQRMKELDDALVGAKHACETEVIQAEEKGSLTFQNLPDDVTPLSSFTPTLSFPHPTPTSISTTAPEQTSIDTIARLSPTASPEDAQVEPPASEHGYFSKSHASYTTSSLQTPTAQPLLTHVPVRKSSQDIRLQSHLSYVQWQFAEQLRVWRWYLRKHPDDLKVQESQFLMVWQYTMPITQPGQHKACSTPKLEQAWFYGENDGTLGQFIEKSVLDTFAQLMDAKSSCSSKDCNEPAAQHCKVFVHHKTRLVVAVEQWEGIFTGKVDDVRHDRITSWSVCRTCGMATPFIPISVEMQRYSFAKFLELYFYPGDVHLVEGAGCQHNIFEVSDFIPQQSPDAHMAIKI